MAAATIQNGDRVHDCDNPDPNDAIVVNQPPKMAGEWDVQSRDCTLADDNPDYPADAPVVVVCYIDDLREYGPPFDPTEQTPLALATLIESPATGFGATGTTETDDGETPTPPEAAAPPDPEPAIIPVSNASAKPTTFDRERASREMARSARSWRQLSTTDP